ncbi:hypothetical protein KJ973_03500 [Patescibacteria group bacterium]|nr:hypothetical protein [Patescibacteria group bacterium]MBU1519727.1 hypothetical protein [Patescibacteria group bacterium]
MRNTLVFLFWKQTLVILQGRPLDFLITPNPHCFSLGCCHLGVTWVLLSLGCHLGVGHPSDNTQLGAGEN